MECLANTGFDASPWLVVAIIAVAAVVAGLLIAKRGRRAGIGTLTVLALGIAATLALAPAPNAHASASECPAPPSNSAQPTPAPTSESTSATPEPTSSSPVPTSSTTEPTPTTTPTTDPTIPTSTTPTTTACVPDQPVLWTAPEADFVNAQPRPSGETEISWIYTFVYQGANAAEVINKLGVTPTENGPALKLNNVTGAPTVTPPAPDDFVFSRVEGSTEGTESVRLDVHFSKTATRTEIDAIMEGYVPPIGKKISATFSIKGAGTDCDGAPVDDQAVLAQCLQQGNIEIKSDEDLAEIYQEQNLPGDPSRIRSVLSTYGRQTPQGEGGPAYVGGSVLGTVTKPHLDEVLSALGVSTPNTVGTIQELQSTPQTAGKYTLGTPTFRRGNDTVTIPAIFKPKLHIINGVDESDPATGVGGLGVTGFGVGITWTAEFDTSKPGETAAAEAAWTQAQELFVPNGDAYASYPDSLLTIPVTFKDECGETQSFTITLGGLSAQSGDYTPN